MAGTGPDCLTLCPEDDCLDCRAPEDLSGALGVPVPVVPELPPSPLPSTHPCTHAGAQRKRLPGPSGKGFRGLLPPWHRLLSPPRVFDPCRCRIQPLTKADCYEPRAGSPSLTLEFPCTTKGTWGSAGFFTSSLCCEGCLFQHYPIGFLRTPGQVLWG